MLGKDSSSRELETIIGPSVKVKGNFSSHGNVKIEGTLDGNLNTTGNVTIGVDAKIKANLVAQELHISGSVEGVIKAAEKLVLTATAKIIGDIETKTLVIEDGAFFSGKCIMGDNLVKKTGLEKLTKKLSSIEDKK